MLGTWINFLGFLRDSATSIFWHRNKSQPTSHQSTILELVLKVFAILFMCEQHIIFKFEPTKRNLRKAMLFCFHLKKSAAGHHRLLVEAYGNYTLTVQAVENWFRRFKSDDFDHPWIQGNAVHMVRPEGCNLFFLLAGHKVEFIAPCGANKSTFWPYSRKKIVCNTEKTFILLVWLLSSLFSGIKLHTRKINFFFPSCTMY